MNKRKLAPAALALLLALTAAVPPALAYFTASVRADGGRQLRFGSNTDITEEFANWTKHATISAEPYTEPSYVRARAFSAYETTISGEGWTDGGDGWFYYATPVANLGEGAEQPAGTVAATGPLDIVITVPDVQKGEVPDGFDMPVVYESTPVRYNADGTPVPNGAAAFENGGQGGAA